METIFALSTGSQRAGIAVIRISGKRALHILKRLTGKDGVKPREAAFCNFCDPSDNTAIDKGLAVYFKSPKSFTGEDVVELSVHGGRAIVAKFLDVLSREENCRLAHPGEFTRRAFELGKMDLTEAEAIADLIDAETEAQRMLALDQLEGSLARLYTSWGDNLKIILAHQEADIEFPEDDMPQDLSDILKPQVARILSEIKNHLNDKRRGERLRNGILIAIIGAPNAGKSSLLNALARRDIAIVSDEAGTTRDVLEAHLNLGGYPVILADTAGLREAENKIEAEGIKRAQKISEEADIKIALFDGCAGNFDAETKKLIDQNTITAITKSDVGKTKWWDDELMEISAKTGAGIDALLQVITDKIKLAFENKNHTPTLTRERHRLALQRTAEFLECSLNAPLPELAAEDLRMAMRTLGSITGAVHVEELLDKIFKDFCIGK